MKFTLQINQKEIIEAGITGVDAIDMLVFDVAMNAIRFGDLDDPEVIDGKHFQWVSYNLLIQELPLLNMSKAAMKRRVANLVSAGLIEKSSANEDQRKLFMALTPLAKKLFTDAPSRVKNEPRGGFIGEQGVGSSVTRNKNTNNNSTINNTPPAPDSQANGDSSEPLKKRNAKVDKTTLKDSLEFYRNQIKGIKTDNDVAAARRREYSDLAGWMYKGDTEIDGGMGDTTMLVGKQLTYDQYNLLRDIQRMTDYQIRHYMIRIHEFTGRFKNNSIYGMTKRYWQDDNKAGKVPSTGPINGHQLQNGQARVSKPSSTNIDYRA